MTSILIYFKSLKWTLQQGKMILLLFGINFLIALLATMPFSSLLNDKLSHSFEADKLIKGFDFTVFSDFMAEYGDAVFVILGQSHLFLMLFFFLSIYLNGGILEHCKNADRKFNIGSFINDCSRNFWKLFFFSITFLIIILAIGGLIFKIFLLTNENGDLAKLPSDEYFFKRFFWSVALFIFLSTIIMMWHDYAKIQFIQQRTSWFRTLKKSFLLVFKNFRKTAFLYLLNILSFLLLAGIYYWISHSFNATTTDLILLSLILGQIFVFGRLGLRVLNLRSGVLMWEKVVKG